MPQELRKILYIEDETDIQTIAKIALESVGGLEVLVCGSGTEAIHQAPEFGPDLILLDVMMPGMDGPDTLVALHHLPEIKDTPAIFLTAKALPSEIERYKDLGALDIIAKPFDPMTLADQVKEIWSGRNG